MKILAISGSTKINSTSGNILNNIAASYSAQLTLDIFNGIDKLPHFNPDLDGNDPPQVVKEFRNRIQSADGVLFCTPEYVFSLPGSLKNAIEWCVSTTVFSNKPVAIIVAAASGEKAFESLVQIMTAIEARIADSLLIKGAKAKIKAEGITDQETSKAIKKLVISLVRAAGEVGVPTKYQTGSTSTF